MQLKSIDDYKIIPKEGLFIPIEIFQNTNLDIKNIVIETNKNEIIIHSEKPQKEKYKTFNLKSGLWDCVGFASANNCNGRNHDEYLYNEKR